ncbi:hypothetical protein FRC03_004639 [Tulasnella sp. 419]|nr:hypothetical protein FRC02_009621 [Tulasnella sp. 418]KAG8962050.1 hypothetical protein FRC03_004639 [Tulasnella sp. 419]
MAGDDYKYLPTDKASIIGYIIGLILYGFYIALYFATNWLLRLKNYKGRIVISTLFALFILSTLQIIAGSYNIYEAFVNRRIDPGPAVYLSALDNVTSPMRDALLFTSCAIADGLLTWRLYVVWDRSRRIIIAPLCLLFAAIVSGVALTVYDVKQVLVGDDRYWRPLSAWTITALALTLFLNLLVTALIAGRLWYIGVKIDNDYGPVGSRFRTIVFAVIESGAIYSSAIAVLMLVYAAGIQVAIYAATYILPQIVSIVPTMIVFQVNFGIAVSAITNTRSGSNPISRQQALQTQWTEDNRRWVSSDKTAMPLRDIESEPGTSDPRRMDDAWNTCIEMEVKRLPTSLPSASPSQIGFDSGGKHNYTDSMDAGQIERIANSFKDDGDSEYRYPYAFSGYDRNMNESGSSFGGRRGRDHLPEIQVTRVITTKVE